MKRRWSIVRVMLAVLLGALAWGLYALWPNSPLLSVSNEEAVGFDEAKGLFYTTTTLQVKDQQVRAYDLTSGVVISSQLLQVPPSYDSHWPLALTPDSRFVIPMSAMTGILPALRLPSLQATTGDGPINDTVRSVGFSADGKLLLVQDLKIEDNKETVTIWDIERNQVYDRIVLSHAPVVLNWKSSNCLPSHRLAMTEDRRHVAAELIDGSFVVYDRDERRIVLQIKDANVIPRFTNTGNTLVLIPDTRYGKSQPIQWYEMEGGKWRLQGRTAVLQGEYSQVQQTDGKHVVTQEYHDIPAWVMHIPESVRSIVENKLVHRKMTLRFVDLRTGELVKTVNQNLPITKWMMYFRDSQICCSSSGTYYTQETNRTLQLWSTSPRRPWLCWLMAGSILLIGVRIGAPRRQALAGNPLGANLRTGCGG